MHLLSSRQRRISWIFLCLISVVSTPAYAYIGPGAGLGMIGVLIAAILVVLVVVFGLVLYPIKLFKRHLSDKKKSKTE